jgi:flagellar protein FlgJ
LKERELFTENSLYFREGKMSITGMNTTDLSTIQYNNKDLTYMQRYSDTVNDTENNTNSKEIDKNSRLYEVSQEFEAIFIKQMLNVMRKTVNKSGLIDGGMAEEIFEDMLYDEYALNMAKTAQFGLADSIYRQLSAYI